MTTITVDSPPTIPLVISTRTLGELIAAIEGYRNQLSVFSDTALGEIELLKYWIQVKIDQDVPAIALGEPTRQT